MFKLITFAILSFAMAQTCTDRKKSFDASSCTDTCTEDCEQRKNDYLLVGCCTNTTKAETKIIENFNNLSPSTLNIWEWGANLIIEVLKKQKNVSITVGEYSSIRESFKNFTNRQTKSLVIEAYELIDSHQQSTITAEGNKACVNQTHIKVCCSKVGCEVVRNSSEVVRNSRRLSSSSAHENYTCYEKKILSYDDYGWPSEVNKLEADCNKCVQPVGENASIVNDIQIDLNNMRFNASEMSFKIGSFPPPREYVVHDFVCATDIPENAKCGEKVPHSDKFYWNSVNYGQGIPKTGYSSLNSFSKNKFDVGGIYYWEHVKFSPRPFDIEACFEADFYTVVRNGSVIKVNPAFFPVDGQVKYTGSGTGEFTLITQRKWNVSVKVIPVTTKSNTIQWSSTPENTWGDAIDDGGNIDYNQTIYCYDSTGEAMKYTFELQTGDTLVFNNIPVFDFDNYDFKREEDAKEEEEEEEEEPPGADVEKEEWEPPSDPCGQNADYRWPSDDFNADYHQPWLYCYCHVSYYKSPSTAKFCSLCPEPEWDEDCNKTHNAEFNNLDEDNQKRCRGVGPCSDASLYRGVHIFAFLSSISAFLWLSPM